jgi:hypothetical protein
VRVAREGVLLTVEEAERESQEEEEEAEKLAEVDSLGEPEGEPVMEADTELVMVSPPSPSAALRSTP